jgi:hypothetical protein
MAEATPVQRIEAMFATLGAAGAPMGFPLAGALSNTLTGKITTARNSRHRTFTADRAIAQCYASASVEMWHRGLHSFIVSTGVWATSKIWASVSGYYASHYVMRAYAHLLGFFLLYTKRELVELKLENGRFHCELTAKQTSDKEHKVYWNIVRSSQPFGADPFINPSIIQLPIDESLHRNKANYWDHVGDFTAFDALTLALVVEKIQRIAEVEHTTVPVPNQEKYADIESVHSVAYHRIVGFRRFLDNTLGTTNRFWNAHRSPSWCRDILKFQFTPPRFMPE